jgi:hypothetical protein
MARGYGYSAYSRLPASRKPVRVVKPKAKARPRVKKKSRKPK